MRQQASELIRPNERRNTMNTAALLVHPGRTSRDRALLTLLLATLTAVAALGLFAKPSSAWQRDDFDFTADGRLVDVQVLVGGRSVPLFTAPGRYDRNYFQAFKGRNYSLVLRNNSDRRIGVLIAVGGLNVISGNRSSMSRNESMYVLDPYEQTTINGWRTSLDEVRKFVFVDEERSYAERTGQANGDMGWIRVLAFREQRTAWDNIRRYRPDERGENRGNDERDKDGAYDRPYGMEQPPSSIDGKASPRIQGVAPGEPEA